MDFHPEETSEEVVSTEVAYQQVQDWLESIYGSNSVPEYEVNAKTINTLHKMMTSNLSYNSNAHELLKSQDKLSEVYTSEGNKISESLKFTGVEMDKLSKPCQLAIKSLSVTACHLDLKDPSEINFLLGLNFMSREKMSISQERRALLQFISSLSKKLNSVLLTNQQLQRDLKNKEGSSKAQELQEEKRSRQSEFLRGKQEEYNSTIKSLTDVLTSCDATPDIYHKALVEKSEEIKRLEAELNEVAAKLKSFQNLPPNENLAKLKIEESKEELLRLEGELQMRISTK